jgi:CRP-like cAMP-binding protein
MRPYLQESRSCEKTDEPTDRMMKTDFISKLIQGKSEAEVIKAFYNGIVRYAGLKDFARAEQLRETMMEMVPNAITEIVKTGEIIENEKTAAMDFEKIKPWAALFNKFTPGEAVAIYYLLKTVTAKVHQRIFQQGDCDNRLYFIESGKLKLSCFDKQVKKNVVFATLEKGDICGVETFFTHTTHTTTLTVLEDAQITYLDKKSYQKLLVDHPSIDAKLIQYCETHQKKIKIQDADNLFRRAHPRFQTTLTGKIQRIDSRGNLSDQVSTVTVADISMGGLCCIARNLGVGEAANLHQSLVQVSFAYQKFEILHEQTKVAEVVSVRFLPFGDSSIHLRFKTPLEEHKVHEIARNTGVTAFL